MSCMHAVLALAGVMHPWQPSDNLGCTFMPTCMQQSTAPWLRMCIAHRLTLNGAKELPALVGCACLPPCCALAGSLQPKALPAH